MNTSPCIEHPLDRAARQAGGRETLANALRVTVAALGNWKARGVPVTKCVAIEMRAGVRRWDLRPADWHLVWPELIGAEGAPDVPATAATGEGADA